jgi:gluconate 2-dehydrogenase
MYFWATGVLSSFLDNAPTYLVFFNTAGGDPAALMTTYASTLAAISAGAVFMGANSYIGNAPNLHFEVDSNQSDAAWSKQDLVARLQGKAGAFTTGGERIDADVLSACPQLRICANMAVGYNNFDLPAMTAAKVLGTNTPDVLTETTADFGFALLMATAGASPRASITCAPASGRKWAFDMFAGSDVHGSTLGILGMGRIGQGIARRGAHGFGMR